jgi:hypothetical protein
MYYIPNKQHPAERYTSNQFLKNGGCANEINTIQNR